LIHETPLDRVSEESYFFRLSDYGEALLELYESQPDFIRPDSRRNEVIAFVRGGLQDLSISRVRSSVKWEFLFLTILRTQSTFGLTRSPTTSPQSATVTRNANAQSALRSFGRTPSCR
jgi:hypothetical protein